MIGNGIPDAAPLVYVIILNWNGTHDTLECLDSLTKLEYDNYRILVVDNGSTESCLDQVKEKHPMLELIQNTDNLGFAGGCNIGIQHALRNNASYVWLLNNDTVVEPVALHTLVDVTEEDPMCGIVGSKILYYDNRMTLNHVGGSINPWLGICEHVGFNEFDKGQHNKSFKVDYVTGCSLLARREMVDQIGLMDDRYFLYYEETDWCVRAQRAGWKVKVSPGSIVYHKVSRSIGKDNPIQYFYFSRNSLRFISRNFPHLLLLSIFWWPRYHFVNHLLNGRFHHLKQSCRGLVAYIRGDWGPLVKPIPKG